MTFQPSNWHKPTPKIWRNLGDALLILGVGLSGIIATLPVPDQHKVWIMAVMNFFTVIGKFLTKLFGEDN